MTSITARGCTERFRQSRPADSREPVSTRTKTSLLIWVARCSRSQLLVSRERLAAERLKDVACTRLGKSARGYVEFFSFIRGGRRFSTLKHSLNSNRQNLTISNISRRRGRARERYGYMILTYSYFLLTLAERFGIVILQNFQDLTRSKRERSLIKNPTKNLFVFSLASNLEINQNGRTIKVTQNKNGIVFHFTRELFTIFRFRIVGRKSFVSYILRCYIEEGLDWQTRKTIIRFDVFEYRDIVYRRDVGGWLEISRLEASRVRIFPRS